MAKTFSIIRGVRACQPRSIQRLYQTRVSCPRHVSIPLAGALELTKTNGPLEGRRRAILPIEGDNFAVRVGPRNVLLDVAAHTQGETMVRLPVDVRAVQGEIAAEPENLYVGKKLHFDLLVVSEVHPDRVVIEQNPNFRATPQIQLLSTVGNLRARGTTITEGIADEAVKDLVEGDFETCLRILSQDHVGEVKQAIQRGGIDEILVRLDPPSVAKIVRILAHGAQRLEKVLERGRLRDVLHFLPRDVQQQIYDRVFPGGEIAAKGMCQRIEAGLGGLPRGERREVEAIIHRGKADMHAVLARLKDLDELDETALGDTLRSAVLGSARAGLFRILEENYVQDIARVVSESRRAKIIEEVRKSNLVDNVKIPLLYILAEREFVCVSMFSFTSPLFAAAITASWLRGADARVLLDRREARQRSSQFDNLERASQALAERYRPSSEFGVRTFSTTSQHLKNILLGSGVIIMGSQNLTTNAFVYNLEDICIITGDPENFAAKRGEFEETFARQGEVVPLPEAVASRHYIARSGVQGVRFLEGTPPPHEVERLFRAFSQLRAGDYRKLSNILEICAGMRAELVVDLERVFHPFSAQIRDPLIAHALLPAFLGEVPLGFCWAPASSTGRYHPGTTTSISGLIEHVFIVLELGIKLCRILGREDLVDQLILAGIAHDAYKNARRAEDGTVTWGPYNPEHGRLAAEEAWRRFASIDGWERSQGLMNAVYTAGAEHMTVWNKPVPTPLEAGDPLLKFILGLADMIASRKYMHLKHRVSLPLTADELMDIMLNNSFSIRGEGLMFLQRDADLFAFMRESAEAFGHPIAEYADVPRRAKKMLRIAESLCDLFQMKDAKDERRHDILAAALLYGTFRYGASHEIGAPQAARDFRTIMRSLRTIYPGDETRAGRVLSLMEAADGKLTRWDRARLTPQDDPALWIVCMANCMMTDPVTWVITDDEVRHYLGKAEVPQTAWARRRLNAAKQAELTEGVEALARREYLADILPHVQAGLLTRLNFRRREPLTGVHPEVMAALVEKYDSLFPSYIYEHFYKPLSSHHRKKAVERIRAANTSAEARAELIDYIRGREVPAAEPPSRVYGLMAQALLVNRVGSVEETVERVVAPVRDRESLRRYDYLPEIPKAVQHIAPKLASEEKILVYGDYDMDGQTGTAILVSTLRRLRQRALAETYMAEDMNQRDARKKAKQVAAETIGYYIPHRVTEGYGLNEGALERIHQRGYGLVITNDCGIRDRKLIARGKKMGIDFIVTDHHQPPAKRSLPKDAVAVINPRVNLPKDHPAYNLVGAGVAYKLALALADNAGLNLGDEFLDLVAVATIADVVQMSGENRAFVRFGLQPSARKNKGLAAVIRTQRLELIDEEAMAFFVAPLFNVLGRLGNAGEGTKLLLYGSAQAAKKIISSMLDSLEIRRETQAAILDAAKQMLSDYDSQTESGIAVAGEWHKGVIGLVASALVKEYGVPAVVIGAAEPSAFAAAEEPAYGSMRCIKGVSPLRILARCDRLYRQENGEPLFLGFGGHHVGAAGFKIEKSKISDFQRIYKEVCKAVVGKKREKIVVGATFQEGEITLEEVKLFRQLIGPFGSGFEDPLFYVPGKVRSWRVFGKDHQHVKGVLKGGTPFIIFYGNQRWIKRVLVENDGNVKMVVRLGMRSFRGKESVSLIVEDIKPRN